MSNRTTEVYDQVQSRWGGGEGGGRGGSVEVVGHTDGNQASESHLKLCEQLLWSGVDFAETLFLASDSSLLQDLFQHRFFWDNVSGWKACDDGRE